MISAQLTKLHQQLVFAEARALDPNWIVRMDGRKEVAEIKRKIEQAERRVS